MNVCSPPLCARPLGFPTDQMSPVVGPSSVAAAEDTLTPTMAYKATSLRGLNEVPWSPDLGPEQRGAGLCCGRL